MLSWALSRSKTSSFMAMGVHASSQYISIYNAMIHYNKHHHWAFYQKVYRPGYHNKASYKKYVHQQYQGNYQCVKGKSNDRVQKS
jgi:hypothetical protein